jgi:hypothetical protein
MKKFRANLPHSCQVFPMDEQPRPTSAEAKKLSDATQDLPDYGRLTPEEAAEFLSAGGRPNRVNP